MQATEHLQKQHRAPTDADTRGEYPLASQRAGQGGWGRLRIDRDGAGSESGARGAPANQEPDSKR